MHPKKQRRRQYLLRFLFAGFSAAAMLLGMLAVALAYDKGTNYFQSGSILPILALLAALLAAAAGTTDAIITPAEEIPSIARSDRFRAEHLPAGIGFLVASITLFATEGTRLSTATAILAAIAFLYCILASLGSRMAKEIKAYLAFTAVISCALLTVLHYFDFTVEMNAPIKLSIQITLLCAMLFFVGEIRTHFDMPASRLYRAVQTWTVSAGMLTSLAVALAFFLKKTDRFDYFSLSITLIGLTATAFLRWLPTAPEAEQNSNTDNDYI